MKYRRLIPLTVVLASAFVAGVLFATLGSNLFDQGDRIGSDVAADTPAIVRGSELPPQLSLDEAFVSVTAMVNPAVVQIISKQKAVEPPTLRPFFENLPMPRMRVDSLPGFNPGQDSLRMFFYPPLNSDPTPGPRPYSIPPREGLGSGVIIRSDGYIVTNYHVVDGASMLRVLLNDGSVEKAEILGTDEESDIAVIKIEKTNLPSVPFGRADDIRVGQWVLAFGSPLSAALDNTVTAGIVSALDRTSAQLTRMNLLSDFIQTDAAINRGNSGGPLVNLQGEMIGINTAILSPTGTNSGVGFAIPVDIVDNVVTQLIDNGRVERGLLGVWPQGISLALASALDVPQGSAQISAVEPGSAADRAGLKVGQIITRVNGITLTDHNQLRIMVGNMRPSEEVRLDVTDDDGTRVYTVELGLRDPNVIAANNARQEDSDEASNNLKELGLTLQTFDAEEFARQEDLASVPSFGGILVQSVDPYGAAYSESDFRQGDVIVEVNKEPISNLREFQRVYNRLEKGGVAILKVQRPVPLLEDGRLEFRSILTAITKPE